MGRARIDKRLVLSACAQNAKHFPRVRNLLPVKENGESPDMEKECIKAIAIAS
jgi:hypothetical protein